MVTTNLTQELEYEVERCDNCHLEFEVNEMQERDGDYGYVYFVCQECFLKGFA